MMPPPGPEAAARMMLGFPGNTTRSCSWTACDRICGLFVSDVQVGDAFNQFVVFQIPPLLAPTYITLGSVGSGAATSMRPEKGKLGKPLTKIGAGPIAVHVAEFTTIGPLSSLISRTAINKMETERTIQPLGLGIKNLLPEYLVGVVVVDLNKFIVSCSLFSLGG